MMQALTTNKKPILVTTQNYFTPFILCTVYGLFSQYLILSMLGGLILTVIFYQFLKPYTPPALFYWFSIQWLQIFAVLLCADFAGQTMDTLMESNNAEFVITMAFLQLGAMCIVANIFYRDNTSSRWKILRSIVQL